MLYVDVQGNISSDGMSDYLQLQGVGSLESTIANFKELREKVDALRERVKPLLGAKGETGTTGVTGPTSSPFVEGRAPVPERKFPWATVGLVGGGVAAFALLLALT